MSLSFGPRLGITTTPATSFKVWAQFSAANSIELQTRVTGTTDWTSQEILTADASKRNTVVLTATGLDPATSYDYRLLESSTQVISEVTTTLPASGRFILYQLNDLHASAGSAQISAWALADWEANYKPLGIPAFVSLMGDFAPYPVASTEAAASTALQTELAKHCGVGLLFSRMQVAYMFDDHDWGGDNSSKDRFPSLTSEGDPEQSAIDLQDAYWRDRPQPASPSYAYSFEVASVPFIFSDTRSQRTPQTNSQPIDDGINGLVRGTLYGAAQLAWLKTTFQTYGRRGLVVHYCSSTYTDQVVASAAGLGADRDSVGLFWQHDRNEVIVDGMIGWGYDTEHNLLVISGDNHWNVMWAE